MPSRFSRNTLCLFLLAALTQGIYAAEQKGSGKEWATVPAEGLINFGDQAPAFPTRARWYGGEKQSLEKLRGRAVLLYFLIPECGSCDAFAPHLKRLEIMKRKDLAIVGISWASRREIHTYVKKRLGKYPILQDPRRAYSNRYIGRVVKFPYLAVLDRQGKLSWFGRGKFHAQVTREVDRAIGGAPAMPKDKPEKSYALLFGAGKTEHGIALRCPANDIALLDKTLKPRFTEVKTLLPCDEKGKSPTLAQVKEALKEMAEKAGEKDLLFCYYSGDGTPVTVDVQKKDLKLQLSDGQITMSEIHAILKESKAGYRFFSLDIGQDGDGRSALEDIADEVSAPESIV
jgi:thiol-disulfide isomerase/thioredoxin